MSSIRREWLRFKPGHWAILIAFAFSGAAAQGAARTVPYALACSTCRIAITPLQHFGSSSDSVLIDRWVPAVMDSKGRVYATTRDRRTIVLFGADGHELAAFGRRGEGPGEIGSGGITRLVMIGGDSLVVFQYGRAAVFDSRRQFVRSFLIPGGTITDIHGLRDGRFVIGGLLETPETTGKAYHVMTRDGRIAHSFGDTALARLSTYSAAPGRGNLPSQPFAVSQDERSLWLALRYRIRGVAFADSQLVSLDVVGSPWIGQPIAKALPGRSGSMSIIDDGSNILPLATTPDGLLWIGASGRAPTGEGRIVGIEVFDPRLGQVLASTRVKDWVSFFPGTNIGWSFQEDTDGIVTVATWRVSFTRR